MVAKLGIYVCPVPGCVVIASKAGACPTHPNKARGDFRGHTGMYVEEEESYT